MIMKLTTMMMKKMMKVKMIVMLGSCKLIVWVSQDLPITDSIQIDNQ